MFSDELKRRGCLLNRKIFLIGIMFFVSLLDSGIFAQDVKIYKSGKKFIRNRQWDKAIESYDELLQQYPKSLYGDDAQFWIGFSLEQTPGLEEKAFDSYQRLIEQYPNSPWVDDAVIHQIYLAKKLVLEGRGSYEIFLRRKLDDQDQSVRYQAALSLGEMKHSIALPILEEMAKDEDVEIARRAMDTLRDYSKTLDEAVEAEVQPIETIKTGSTLPKAAVRYILHTQLGVAGENWTEDALIINGLYHIISQDELLFYLSLENEWDRQEWWRKYWARQDPTPTTPENEAEEEYRRRVLFVWKSYGKVWDSMDDYYPPWDTRGELYIKYGKPDHQEEADDDKELWMYYSYKVNFLVSTRLPNTHGEGLDLGTVSRYLYRKNMRPRRNYLGEPGFYFINPSFKKTKRIEDFDLRITSTSRAGSMYRIRFTYQFSASNLRFKKENDKLEGAYRYRWVVLDDDYRTQSSSDAVEELAYSNKEDVLNSKVFRNFHVSLIPGSYTLALRIEGTRSNKLGIYRKSFTIQGKGDIQEELNDKNGNLTVRNFLMIEQHGTKSNKKPYNSERRRLK